MNFHFATFILLLLFHTSLSASEKLQLRQVWEVGKIYTQETKTDMRLETQLLSNPQIQKTNITQTQTITVSKDGETDHKVAEVKIASIIGSTDFMGQTMTYNSSDPAKSPPFLQQAFGALAGKSFLLIYDADNVFIEQRAPEYLAAATPLGATKSMSNPQFSDVFRKSQEIALPKDPVSVGDTWHYQDKIEMPPIGTILIEATGKFDSIIPQDGHQQARLLIEGTFVLPSDEANLMSFAPGSKFVSEVLYDLDRKVVTHSNMDSTFNVLVDGKETPITQGIKARLISIESIK